MCAREYTTLNRRIRAHIYEYLAIIYNYPVYTHANTCTYLYMYIAVYNKILYFKILAN